MKKLIRSPLFPFVAIILFCLVIYLPIIINPNLIFLKRNDLTDFFVPLVEYSKLSILNNHLLPLWNNFMLSGTPLVSDPQSPLFYLPNLIFLITNNIRGGFLILFIIHTIIGTIGIYLCGKYLFKFGGPASLLASLFYFFIIRTPFYLEAGHVGLVYTTAYLPLILLSYKKLLNSKNYLWSICLGVCMAEIYYLHTVTFVVVFFALILLFIIDSFFSKNTYFWKKTRANLTTSIIVFFGLTAVVLLPQLAWFPETTRKLILVTKELHPIWLSKKEFLYATLLPWLKSTDYLGQLDTEKFITVGMGLTFLSLGGLFLLDRKKKIIIILSAIIVGLFALNNLTPFGKLLSSQSLFLFLRVTTRFWLLNSFIIIFLAMKCLDKYLEKTSWKKRLVLIIFILSLIELTFVSYSKLIKAGHPQNFVPEQLINIIKNDKGLFRVFCLNRCIPQNIAATNNIQLVEGYSTIQQYNYYRQMWQFTNNYWNYYTLSLPPIGLYTFSTIKPDAKALGEFNTKYVISPYPLDNPNFQLAAKEDSYLLYLNKLFLPRTYLLKNNHYFPVAEVVSHSPNEIVVKINQNISDHLILAEVYSKGWKAYLNGTEAVRVQERPNALQSADINNSTKFVTFRYEPKGYKFGLRISSITLAAITLYLFYKFGKNNGLSKLIESAIRIKQYLLKKVKK
jgi:hypothetical protein